VKLRETDREVIEKTLEWQRKHLAGRAAASEKPYVTIEEIARAWTLPKAFIRKLSPGGRFVNTFASRGRKLSVLRIPIATAELARKLAIEKGRGPLPAANPPTAAKGKE
jgi:hypothetical protein